MAIQTAAELKARILVYETALDDLVTGRLASYTVEGTTVTHHNLQTLQSVIDKLESKYYRALKEESGSGGISYPKDRRR